MWIRRGLALSGVLLLAVAVSAVLLIEPAPTPAPQGIADVTPEAVAPRRDEAPPPADRPSLEAPAAMQLSPLATRWRRAVILNRRREVLQGAAALRRAPDGRKQLLSLARDRNARIRAFAFRELGRRREAALTPVFEEALADASPYVRENARWALGELKRRRR